MSRNDLKELLARVWSREDNASEAYEIIEAEMNRCIRGDGQLIYQIDLTE